MVRVCQGESAPFLEMDATVGGARTFTALGHGEENEEGDNDDPDHDEFSEGHFRDGHSVRWVGGDHSMSPIIHIIGQMSTTTEGNPGQISILSACE